MKGAAGRKQVSVCGMVLGVLLLMVAPEGAAQVSDAGSAIRRPQAVLFRFEPCVARVPLGRDILFRGTFLVAEPALLARLRTTPLVLQWRVVKQGGAVVVLQGEVRIHGPRTLLRAGTRPAEPGVYELVFVEMPHASYWPLRLEYGERNRIEVYVPASGVRPSSLPEKRRKSNE